MSHIPTGKVFSAHQIPSYDFANENSCFPEKEIRVDISKFFSKQACSLGSQIGNMMSPFNSAHFIQKFYDYVSLVF